MSAAHAQGRLGSTLNTLSYRSLKQLLDNLDSDDLILRGESMAIIQKRMEALKPAGLDKE